MTNRSAAHVKMENTSCGIITEVKHLKHNQLSDGSNPLGRNGLQPPSSYIRLIRYWGICWCRLQEKKSTNYISFFTCGLSPGLRTGSVQWIKFWLFTFSKNYKSSDRAWYIQQKGGKHNLKYLQFLEIWKNDKPGGNQYLENFHLAELGMSNKRVENISWNICNSLKSEKMTSLVETNS